MSEKQDEKAENAKEREERGIPPEMEKGESKGGPNDSRLESETAHGKPEGRNPTGEG
jgi:hypothetical protein